MDVKESFQQRFEQALASSDLKPSELAEKTGISQATISQYRSGYSKPKQPRLMKLATALGVSPVWLMGLDVSMHDTNQESSIPDYSNIFPLQRKRVPLLGEIACGEPIFCNEGRESYIAAGTDIKAAFCLKARGDSMTGARILDGDIVFIQKDAPDYDKQKEALAEKCAADIADDMIFNAGMREPQYLYQVEDYEDALSTEYGVDIYGRVLQALREWAGVEEE